MSARPPGSVLVTGSSTGIGRACAQRLDRAGWRVLAGVRREEDGERLRAEASDRLEPVIVDVTDGDSIRAATDRVLEATGGRLDGLVNNAGVAVSGPLEFLPPEDLRAQLEVNLVGHVAVTQALIPALRTARGRVVNMGSVGGRIGQPFVGPYSASKAALASVSESLRRELRPWGIWVAVVEPGSVATPIWEKGQRRAHDFIANLPPRGRELYGETLERMTRVAGKVGERGIPPDEVAQVVERVLTSPRPRARYLLGPEARIQFALSRALPARAFDGLIDRAARLAAR